MNNKRWLPIREAAEMFSLPFRGTSQESASSSAESLLTVAEVSRILNCHRQTTYRLLNRRSDRLPHYKLPGIGIRFSRSDVLAWLEAGKRDLKPSGRKA